MSRFMGFEITDHDRDGVALKCHECGNEFWCSNDHPMCFECHAGINIHAVMHQVFSWSNEAFGERSPKQLLEHMLLECEECIDEPHDITEYADVGMLLFDAARFAGFTVDDVLRAMMSKLEFNKTRSWTKRIPMYQLVIEGKVSDNVFDDLADLFSTAELSGVCHKNERGNYVWLPECGYRTFNG